MAGVKTQKVELARKRDIIVDVVIVGYGGAGATAAITARDAGAEVLILEKQTAGRHIPSTALASRYMTFENMSDGVGYVEEVCRGGTPKEMIQTYVKGSMEIKQWITDIGGKIGKNPLKTEGELEVTGSKSVRVYRFVGTPFDNLAPAVTMRGIKVLYGTRAKELILKSGNEVLGVEAEGEQKRITIKAKRAVVLTCGGFEWDEELKLNNLLTYPAYFYGAIGNTGDGIRMAQKAGAGLWHMSQCSMRIVAYYPECEIAFSPSTKGGNALFVDRNGNRFANETFKAHNFYRELSLFDTYRSEYPRIPFYWIFDESRIRGGRLMRGRQEREGKHGLYVWSEDNNAELERGWIIKGDTVKKLAEKIKIDPFTLRRTIHKYNSYCRAGKDPEFGKAAEYLRPVIIPPYYAIELWPGGAATFGGPKRNAHAQILDAFGSPIRRLYGAGELGCSLTFCPGSGSKITDCIVFGRIAGKNAAAEKPKR